MFPNLQLCRIVSCDWEPSDEEFMHDGNLGDFWNNNACWRPLGHEIIREIITHDIVEDQTRITPFRRIKVIEWPEGSFVRAAQPSSRAQRCHEWRDDDDIPYMVSLEEIEPYMEGCWSRHADGTRRANPPRVQEVSSLAQIVSKPTFPYHHIEKYDGLLDRGQVRERRIEKGLDWRYCSL